MSTRVSVVLGHVVPSGERFNISIAHTVITARARAKKLKP